jgi:adenosylhomocysteine nucleosidase
MVPIERVLRMKTVLLVSSMAGEFGGLTRRFAATPLAGWPIDYAAQILRGNERWILAANGAGADLALEAFHAARGRYAIDAVVSTGYCGALDPAIAAAEVVVATQVFDQGEAFPAGAAGTSRAGAVVGANRVVALAAEKQALFQATGAATVDMESHALARASQQAGIPFYCVRAVTDVAREDMHLDFDGARDARGRFSSAKLLASSLQHPFTALPDLFKLAFRARRASNHLGDFLADCRF